MVYDWWPRIPSLLAFTYLSVEDRVCRDAFFFDEPFDLRQHAIS